MLISKPNKLHRMKSKLFIASAALTTLCCIYFVRLNQKAESFDQANFSAGIVYNQNDQNSLNKSIASSEKSEATFLGVKFQTTKSTLFVNNQEDATVYGKKGTALFFPAGTFVDGDGNDVAGQVKIKLEECYDLSEILAAKLSTTSDGNLIETAGMINVKAFSGSSEVFLREGRSYELFFPKNGNENNDFRLFYGEWQKDGIINWNVAEDDLIEDRYDAVQLEQTNLSARIDSSEPAVQNTSAQIMFNQGQTCFINISESHFRRGTKISEMDYFNWKLASGENLNQWFVSNFNPDPQMLNRFCDEGLRSQITFKVNGSGDFMSYYISQESITDYDRLIANFLSTMPALDLSQLMPNYNDDHACILTFSSRRGDQPEQFVAQFKRAHKDNPDKPLSNVDMASLDYFVFNSSQLGWINCDRFLETEENIEFVVNSSSGSDCSVSMVFSDINSVMKGVKRNNDYVFSNVPKNRDVRIIGLDSRDGNALMCVNTTNTGKRSANLTTYKPVSIIDLESEFSQ